jgi:hypothetical protein
MYHLETPYVMSVSHLCSLRSITWERWRWL